MSTSFYSESYSEARRRFVEAADDAGADVLTHGIEHAGNEDLSIDVATLGPSNAPAIVVSSGVHGVEGFFGSAVQLSLLERLRDASESSVRYVLIHAVNPYGFAHLRRADEENIDLNRNFLRDESSYSGAPDAYRQLDTFLNPVSPPRRFELFKLTALWQIRRHGLQMLKQAVAGGQYEFTRGLFFGGRGPSQSMQVVRQHCEMWIGDSQEIVHIDLHSGLGRFGTLRLLVSEDVGSDAYNWYAETFGRSSVEPLSTGATAYRVSGLFGEWLTHRFHDRHYRFVGAEFGTYGILRVLSALRAENRQHHFGAAKSEAERRVKTELMECFCPRSSSWRERVVADALQIVGRAAGVVSA